MYRSVIKYSTRKDEKMKKAKIKIIIYQENGKTKVKLKKKIPRKSTSEIKNLYLVLTSKIRDILMKI